MRVFVTGASGFVGSAVVSELLQHGHKVLGLVRTASAATAVRATGAEAHMGNLDDLESLKQGAAQCDAVIHTAFNHDFSRYKASCEDDRKVIQALGEALAGSRKPLVVTSGIGILRKNGLMIQNDTPPSSDVAPRAATEEAAGLVAAWGVNTYIVRLPHTTHGKDDHGFIPMVIALAKEKQRSVFIDEGHNHWPAVHRFDAAVVYRLIIEKQLAQKVYHPVAEAGITFKEIATAIGNGLKVPAMSIDKQTADAHFGWFTHFAGMDCVASSEQTREALGWAPKHPGLLDELVPGVYF